MPNSGALVRKDVALLTPQSVSLVARQSCHATLCRRRLNARASDDALPLLRHPKPDTIMRLYARLGKFFATSLCKNHRPHARRRKTTEALVPPNPNEFDSATSILRARGL